MPINFRDLDTPTDTGCKYCETLNICCIKFSWSSENEILAHFNFGVHDIP